MLKQQLQLKLAQKLSPQQIQLMKLVQLPTIAFEQRVKEELEENPALEVSNEDSWEDEDNFDDSYDTTEDEYEDNQIIEAEDINVDEYLSDDEIPDYRLYANNYNEEEYSQPYREEVSFHQYLLDQLSTFRLDDKQREIDEIIAEQKLKLSEIAKVKPEEAKEQIFQRIEEENQKEIVRFIQKFKTIKAEEADKEAAQILAQAMPKLAADTVSEFTSKMIDLPNEDFKGKLIGREGRNISLFEKLTGVELLVDDTPLSVRISST